MGRPQPLEQTTGVTQVIAREKGDGGDECSDFPLQGCSVEKEKYIAMEMSPIDPLPSSSPEPGSPLPVLDQRVLCIRLKRISEDDKFVGEIPRAPVQSSPL